MHDCNVITIVTTMNIRHQNFRSLFQHTLCAALLPLLQTLPADYVAAYQHQLRLDAQGNSSSNSSSGGERDEGDQLSASSYLGKDAGGGGTGSAAATVTKIVRIAR